MLRGRSSPALIALFGSGGTRLVAGGAGGTVDVWDVASGRKDGVTLRAGGDIAYGFVDPTDATRLFTVSSTGTDGEILLWDRGDPTRPQRVGAPFRFPLAAGAAVGGVPVGAVSSDGRLLAAGTSLRGTTFVWDLQTGTLLHDLPGATGGWVPGTHTLATAQFDRISLWNADNGVPNGDPLTGFAMAVGANAFSADGTRLAALDADNGIRVFDLASRAQLGVPLGLDTDDLPIAFLPDDRLLTSGVTAMGLWHVGTSVTPLVTELPGGAKAFGHFVPGTPDVIVEQIDEEGGLSRWDASSGAARGPVLAGEARDFFGMSSDGASIAAPLFDRSGTGIWDTSTGKRLATFDGGEGADWVAAWSPAAPVVATMAASDDSVRLWDTSDPEQPVSSGQLILKDPTLPMEKGSMYPFFSPDGGLLAVIDWPAGTVTVFDVRERREVWSQHVGSTVTQLAFAPDGMTLAVKSVDRFATNVVTLWDVEEWTPRRSFVVPGSAGIGVEFLRGGSVLATTSEITSPGSENVAASTSVQLWDVATLEPIGEPLPLGATGSGYIGRDADGARAFIGSLGGTAVVWDVDPGHWEELACEIAGRNLTRAEWQRYLPGVDQRSTCPQWAAGE